jgi:uncharacterized protein YecA (UPF0149 family)
MRFTMSSKTVPFSARISLEDASFISNLSFEGAVTPSDKLRSSYAENLQQMQDWLAPLQHQWQIRQQQVQQPAEVMAALLQWLPEMLALVQSHSATLADASASQLRQTEFAVLQQLYRLNAAVLPLQLQRGYQASPNQQQTQRQDLVRLAELITSTSPTAQGE